jgi:hypothetical protein
VRAEKMSDSERQSKLNQLDQMLADWRRKVPVAYGVGLDESLPLSVKRHLIPLHYTHLYCTLMLHQVNVSSLENSRIKRLTDWAIGLSTDALDAVVPVYEAPPLPPKWQHCVDQARGCMALMRHVHPMDYGLIW